MRVALAGKFHHMKCPDPFMIFLIIIACLLDSPDSCQSFCRWTSSLVPGGNHVKLYSTRHPVSFVCPSTLPCSRLALLSAIRYPSLSTPDGATPRSTLTPALLTLHMAKSSSSTSSSPDQIPTLTQSSCGSMTAPVQAQVWA